MSWALSPIARAISHDAFIANQKGQTFVKRSFRSFQRRHGNSTQGAGYSPLCDLSRNYPLVLAVTMAPPPVRCCLSRIALLFPHEFSLLSLRSPRRQGWRLGTMDGKKNWRDMWPSWNSRLMILSRNGIGSREEAPKGGKEGKKVIHS